MLVVDTGFGYLDIRNLRERRGGCYTQSVFTETICPSFEEAKKRSGKVKCKIPYREYYVRTDTGKCCKEVAYAIQVLGDKLKGQITHEVNRRESMNIPKDIVLPIVIGGFIALLLTR